VELNIRSDEPVSSTNDEHTRAVIRRSVYDYAAIVHEQLESSCRNKLDDDIAGVLGSSDPPPGFGYCRPKVYYLEQRRPLPMEPLPVSH
jgi:hypothetical protein